MNHGISARKLNRTSSHRAALLRHLACALILEEHIQTTTPKAKELRRFVEPLITRAANRSLANLRYLKAKLGGRMDVVYKLLDDVGPFYTERPGGYTRVLKTGFRAGDAAPMSLIQLVGRPWDQRVKDDR